MPVSEASRAPREQEPSPAAHFARLGIALVALVVMFVLIRNAVVPATFGDEGHFRAASLGEIGAQQVKFVGSFGCGECHAERAASYAAGKHKFQCESCHGPATGHLTTVDAERTKLAVHREYTDCLGCHEKTVGRPESQPQIDPAAHAEENDFELGGAVCLDCHNVED